MRSVNRELLSFGLVVSLPLAMFAVFPYGAIGFKASHAPVPAAPFAAFVTLSPREEARATAAVKAAWQGDSGALRHIRADLSVGELPEESPGPVLEISLGDLRVPSAGMPVGIPPFPPSMRSARAEKISPSAPVIASPAFTKEELLKID